MIRSNRKRRPTKKQRAQSILKHTGRLCMRMTVVMLILAGGWWLNQAMSVERWTVRGVPEQLDAAIDAEMNSIKTPDFIHTIPFVLRRRLLSGLPDLEDVNIVRRLPDSVDIIARERIPVALWLSADGKVFLVDGAGLAYRALRRGEHADLPLLRLADTDLNAAMRLIRSIKQQDYNRYQHLSELIGGSDYWRLNFERGRSWLLPRGTDNARRMRKITALLRQKRWRGGRWRVDARMSTRWFIRESKIGGMV